MSREQNVRIFEDTKHLVETNERIKVSVQNYLNKQKLILEAGVLLKPVLERYEECAKIVLSTQRTFEAANEYKNMKVAVHNFAFVSNLGGGVVSH